MAFIQPITIPMGFSNGLMDKTDALQLQPPNLLQLQNGMFSKTGQINKRPGYDILPNTVMNGGTITSAVALDNFNDELNLFDNQNIYTYIASNENWANRGTAISLINTDSQVIRRDDAQQINPDSNCLNGLEVHVWEDSRGGVRYSVLDTATGAYPVSDALISGVGAKPKVIMAYVGDESVFYVFFNDQLNNIYYRIINPNNPYVIQPQVPVIAVGNMANLVYDVTLGNNKYIYLVAATTVAGVSNNIAAYYIEPNGSISSGENIATLQLTDVVSCLSVVYVSNDKVWISWGGTTNGVQGVYSTFRPNLLNMIPCPNLLIAAETASTITGIESMIATSLQLVYEVVGDSPSDQSVGSVIVSQNRSVTSVGSLLSVGIATKPFRYNNNLFINLTHQSNLQSTYFTTFLTNAPFTIVGKVGAQVGGGLRTNGMLAEVGSLSSGVFLWDNLIKGQFISEDNTNFSILGVNSTVTDFTNTNKFNSATYSNNLLFVGGILQSYDGISVVEQNFHLFPENITFTVIPYGGALSVGQYQYQFVYAWTDKFGQIQYSGTSVPLTVTITEANSSVQLNIDTIRLTAKTGVVVQVYRTQVNQTTFQQVTSTVAPLLNSNNTKFSDLLG